VGANVFEEERGKQIEGKAGGVESPGCGGWAARWRGCHTVEGKCEKDVEVNERLEAAAAATMTATCKC
jgi:hypothetical protein